MMRTAQAVIDRASDAGVSSMLTVGTEVRYFPKVVEIIEAHPQVYGAVGIHPHNAKDYSPEIEETIKGYLKHPKVVGCGEIGLDFYRDYSPRDAADRGVPEADRAGPARRASGDHPLEERQAGDP